MINIYPANRLENLVILLERVMQTGANANVLDEEIILVQSKGMQHWLNLKLAENRGISMNLAFSLPMQFFWNQIRAILGKEAVPEQSTYTREVLSWRIHALLANDAIIDNPLCREATHYWLGKHHKQRVQSSGDEDKRYQLACQVADLFEQYLIFRPDWLLDWENGQATHWQALLWQFLVAQEPQHPIALLKQAMASLEQNKCRLSERISLFGINTLPPLWLEFLSALGNQTQVHFFHLNPCVEYWGDLKTDKAYAREQFYQWLNSSETILSDQPESANPLLSNLGSQGKDCLYLLQELSSIEIPVYESPDDLFPDSVKTTTVLQNIQSDILNLRDIRETPQKHIDDSIVIASAHSALREIQALHDWLLHQINSDASLTPKDILVMCPNVENYAPYVEAVFAHGWNDWSERVPPLPCSIADRTLKDSEPLVQVFIDLLDLPDSRFQVSQIMGYLRLPAVQKKFAFSQDDLLLLERWVNHAAIHWGLDAVHKQQILAVEKSNDKFSWQQGLNRLLLGFAQSDQCALYQDQLLLPDVEGDEALLLGRYFELLEQLQFYAVELQTPRSPEDWQQFLLQAKDNLFSPLTVDNNAQQIIAQAIDDLGEYTSQAHYEQAIPLAVIRDFLLAHFNQPEPGRQFMAGQVTFCSMVPMRSVPFRMIAVLGLNDGEFPRQRQPMGFDLMATEPPRKGDRSRRGDDRYLFLEALISCRDKLYLSYQGHDIKTNNSREPSLVLQELMDYLEQGYGWQLSDDERQQLFKIPLQAFSRDNYRGLMKSFNPHWLKLSKPGEPRNNLPKVAPFSMSDGDAISITAEQLVQFFDNPCRQFAQTRLGLYFDNGQDFLPEDSEPFVSNHLDRYQIQDAIIKTALADNTDKQAIDDLVRCFSLSGKLPDTPGSENDLLQWQEQASDFAEYIHNKIHNSSQNQEMTQSNGQIVNKTVQIIIDDVHLEAELPWLDDSLLFWRLATPKGKDDIRLWIHHLIAQVITETNITETNSTETGNKTVFTHGFFRGEKDEPVLTVQFEPLTSARELLAELVHCWKEGMQQPLLLHASLGQKHCAGKALDEPGFYTFWQDDFQTQGLGSDPYVHWFWAGDKQEIPQWQGDWQERIEKIYQPLYAHRQEKPLYG